MGSMSSPSKTANNLRFEKIPKKPLKSCSFAQSGSVILIRGAKGTLYTNCSLARHAHYGRGLWGFSYDITECLDQLGILTPEDRVTIDKFHTHCEKIDAAKELLRAAAKIAKGEDKIDGISRRVDQKKVKAAWDLLDYYDQKDVTKYGDAPKNAVMKPEPKRDL